MSSEEERLFLAPSLLQEGAEPPRAVEEHLRGNHLSPADPDQPPTVDELLLCPNYLSLRCLTNSPFPPGGEKEKKRLGQDWAEKTRPATHTESFLSWSLYIALSAFPRAYLHQRLHRSLR